MEKEKKDLEARISKYQEQLLAAENASQEGVVCYLIVPRFTCQECQRSDH